MNAKTKMTKRTFILSTLLLVLGQGCSQAPTDDPETCLAGATYLTHLPVEAQSDYQGVIPQGLIAPVLGDVFPSNRIYFHPFVDDAGANPATFSEFAVTAPGNLEVKAVRMREYDLSGIREYAIFFKPCSSIRIYLDHLSSLSAEFQDKLNEARESWNSGDSSECIPGNDAFLGDYNECLGRFYRVTVDAQDFLGTAGKYRPLALGAYDQEEEVPYLTPEHYTQSLSVISDTVGLVVSSHKVWEVLSPTYLDYKHAACPLNYYGLDPTAASFPTVHFVDLAGNAFADWDGTNCGTFLEQSAARATGNWFLEEVMDEVLQSDGVGLFGADRFGLSLAHDYVNENAGGDRGYPAFSFGEAIAITGGGLAEFPMGRYDFVVNSAGTVNRDFNSLILNTAYCWEGLTRRDGASSFAGAVWLKMTDAHTLTFQAFDTPGDDCSNTALDGFALTFIR